MARVLVSWIGTADLRAAESGDPTNIGPVAQALAAREYDNVILLADQEPAAVKQYEQWIASRTSASVATERVRLTSPTHFGEIYAAARAAVDRHVADTPAPVDLTFHLSPGTPAMAAVWIILGKTRYRSELIESSRQYGVKTASVPFDISAEFIPDLLSASDEQLRTRSAEPAPEAPEFADIVYRSQPMQRLIARARKAAVRTIPVLIEGESGTGKELLARAIVRASPRREKPLRVVNCGAIPSELVESELFGHVKGAFTGAANDRTGYFEDAHGGTLFLDEIGELPLPAQVKLLRVLQEGEVTRIGASQPKRIDVRIIAATNRNLIQEVAGGRFREDLFYRLAVIVLKVPPLREREGDLGLLVDSLLNRINEESRSEPGFVHKKLSVGARNLIIQHSWPGNIRELQNTLRRALIWSEGETISAEDMREALLTLAVPQPATDGILDCPIGQGFDLPAMISRVARHYLERALDEARGNKTVAAKLVGLPSYQTLTNWLSRYGVRE